MLCREFEHGYSVAQRVGARPWRKCNSDVLVSKAGSFCAAPNRFYLRLQFSIA